MLYGNYAFKCRFTSTAQLPVYKGSTFRGVFGRALKQVICALKRQECPTCLLKRECLYPLVFEPHLIIDAPAGPRNTAPPHPFVIQPPPDEQTLYPENAAFNFSLLLFGPVNRRLPYFVYALDEMGNIGVGKKVNGRRGRFVLEQVVSQGRVVYTRTDHKIDYLDLAQDLYLPLTQDEINPITAVTLRFNTPLRLKHDNRLTAELPFHVLVRAILRRISALTAFFDQGEPDLDYPGLVRRANAVRIRESSLAWVDWKRYSHRQDQAMMMGGLKGSVTYEGELEEYLPLLDFCARVHIGKQTTFGLGRFNVEVES